MINIDRDLNKMKNELDNLTVPHQLEIRLRESLDGIPKKRYRPKLNLASLILAIVLIGFGGSTLANYTKKIIGYENVMNGTLRELNKLGRSQIIDKSHILEDGTKITLDAIMLDANNLVLFYNLYNASGLLNDEKLPMIHLSGSRGLYRGGGHGEVSKDGTEMKWVMTYHAPKFYEKNLKMIFQGDTGPLDGEINFQIDRKKAMAKELKINIDKEIKVLDNKIKVKSLVASPISTVVKGGFQNIFELGLDHLKKERTYFESIEMVLLANGKPVDLKSSSMSTGPKGSYFNITFDSLPKDTEKIQLKLISLGANQVVNERITLDKDSLGETYAILDEDILINKVFEEKGNTYISITTDKETYLSSLYLDIDGQEAPLEQTIEEDSTQNYRTRTAKFKGTGEHLELLVKTLRFKKDVGMTIYTEEIK
ncbi:MAG TPA: DUF4179 domain-containing protein [Epulopiscium sp.]|nr:DUF4179 domain-containing protein [Candidatus Epulonipiscium sp.]